jgi:hypothetical protein
LYHSRPGYVPSGAARGALYRALEQPRTQPQVARAFAAAIQDRNATLFLSMIFTPVAGPPGHSGGADLARLAVTCADSPWKPVPTAEDVADELLAGLQVNSPHFGASPIITEPDGGCHFWPTRGRAPERFTGPWNASLEYRCSSSATQYVSQSLKTMPLLIMGRRTPSPPLRVGF